MCMFVTCLRVYVILHLPLPHKMTVQAMLNFKYAKNGDPLVDVASLLMVFLKPGNRSVSSGLLVSGKWNILIPTALAYSKVQYYTLHTYTPTHAHTHTRTSTHPHPHIHAHTHTPTHSTTTYCIFVNADPRGDLERRAIAVYHERTRHTFTERDLNYAKAVSCLRDIYRIKVFTYKLHILNFVHMHVSLCSVHCKYCLHW